MTASNKDLEKLTTTPWLNVSTITEQYGILFKQSYLNIAPINITLGILIIFLNSLVVSHYYKNRSKITCTLFLLISISDIATALGNIIFSVGVILWSENQKGLDKMMWWCLVVFRVVGLLGYSCSILFNTFLAVLRTIKIYNPFYRPRIKPVIAFGLGYMSVLVALTGFDLNTFFINPTFKFVVAYWFLVGPAEDMYMFPGQTLVWLVFVDQDFSSTLSAIIEFTILSLINLIPVLTTMTSMIIQIYIGHQQSRDSDTELLINDWAHVNTTVFLLASVFFICNGSLSLLTLITYLLNQSYYFYDDTKSWGTFIAVQSAVLTFLPLLNATLSPVIIVVRNKKLLREIMDRLRCRVNSSD